MLDLTTAEDDDDLEVFWDEIRPRDPRRTLEGGLRSDLRVLSVGGGEPVQKAAQECVARYLLETKRAIPLRMTGAHQRWPVGSIDDVLLETFHTWRTLLSPDSGDSVWTFLFALLHAVQLAPSDRLRALKDPLARHLAAVHGRVVSPVFATDTLHSWLLGGMSGWSTRELELLGMDHQSWQLERDQPHIQLHRRLIRLLLLGGVYGLYETAMIYVKNMDALIRTPLKSTYDCRQEADRLDTLLTELEGWEERTTVKVLIGWSGHDEDAKLLQGLHAPLFAKIQTARVDVLHA